MIMASLPVIPLMFALSFVGVWEMVLILAVILILLGAKKIPEIRRGLREGVSRFRTSADEVAKGLDQAAHNAGESLGGIYG
jgi:sec-independent protein translocase protein TatA